MGKTWGQDKYESYSGFKGMKLFQVECCGWGCFFQELQTLNPVVVPGHMHL